MSDEKLSKQVIEIIRSNNVKKMKSLLEDSNFDQNALLLEDSERKIGACITPLILSIMWKKDDLVRVLADNIHTNLNAPSENGKTPLIYAIEEGHIDTALYLLKRKASAKIQTGSEKPLEMILVKLFYAHEDNNDLTKLKELAVEVLKTRSINLLDDINNGESYYDMALRYLDTAKTEPIKEILSNIVKMMEQDHQVFYWLRNKEKKIQDSKRSYKKYSANQFIKFIENKDVNAIKKALKAEHSYNLQNGYYIYAASKTGSLKTIEALTEHGFEASDFIMSSLFSSFVFGNNEVFNHIVDNHLSSDNNAAWTSSLVKNIVESNNPRLLDKILKNQKIGTISEDKMNDLMRYAFDNDLSECAEVLSKHCHEIVVEKDNLAGLEEALDSFDASINSKFNKLNDALEDILDKPGIKKDNKNYTDILNKYTK